MSLRPKVERREGAIPDTTARAIAARLEKAAARARERGLDLDAVADMQGEALALLAALYPEEARVLSRSEYSPKLGPMAMVDAHREAISRSKTKDSPLMRAARKKGFLTQKEVAEAIGMKPNFLSAIVKGVKKMPPESAELLLKKTGYRWPD